MKTALRIAVIALSVVITGFMAPQGVSAETRGKALKRAEKEVRQANFVEAEKIYRELLDRNQKDKEARLGLSHVLVKQNKLVEGFEEAAQVLSADPLSSRAHALLGIALLRGGEFRNSIEALYTAVKFNDREAMAIAGLSEIEYFENRTRNAYAGLKRAIFLDGAEPDYYISLARVCSRLEYYREAADTYQRFLQVSPKTDAERRARIQGLIDFYRFLGNTKIQRTGGKEVTTIPFSLINHRPFIEVMINGKGPLKFVIDTGASLSVISDKVADQLGIRPAARGGKARAVGGTGTFPIVYGLLDSLSIGESRIESVPVYIRTVHSTDDMPEHQRADGYLGLSVLSNFKVSIDYQNKTMMLDRTPIREGEPVVGQIDQNKDPQDPPVIAAVEKAAPVEGETAKAMSGVEIPIRTTSGGLASTETKLPNLDRPLNFIIDTGATVSVISKAAVKRHSLEGLKIPGETYRVIGAAGIEEGAEALRLSNLNVSGLKRDNSRALILDLEAVNETSGFEQHGILGGDYLANFLVVIDLRRHQFKLTPQNSAISIAEKQ